MAAYRWVYGFGHRRYSPAGWLLWFGISSLPYARLEYGTICTCANAVAFATFQTSDVTVPLSDVDFPQIDRNVVTRWHLRLLSSYIRRTKIWCHFRKPHITLIGKHIFQTRAYTGKSFFGVRRGTENDHWCTVSCSVQIKTTPCIINWTDYYY